MDYCPINSAPDFKENSFEKGEQNLARLKVLNESMKSTRKTKL
jgi:hypothetical protein